MPGLTQKEKLHMIKIAQIAPYGQKRNAPDSIYPLRGLDGRTWAERGGFITQAMIDRHGSYAAARAARKEAAQ